MANPGKKYMYPRAEEGRGPGSLDFSQAFKTSHLGEVLCTTNPLQQKFLEQQWEDLDRAKRRRENALFHYKRNFFIAQVFGKGLNPHLNKGTDQPEGDDESDSTDPGGDFPNHSPNHSDVQNLQTQETVDHVDSESEKAPENSKRDSSIEDLKDNGSAVERGEKHKKPQVTFSDLEPASTMMITESREIEQKPRSRASSKSIMHRSQTSGELNVRRGQSQSLPTLTSAADVVTDVTSQPSTARDKLHVSFMQERAKSTSDLADSVSKRVSTTYTLPSINSNSKNSLQRKPEIIVEEDEDSNTDYEVISVHTTTDHVGLSALRREQRNDIASLRRDPSRLFPKMRLLLNSYDSDTQETFHQIMKLGGGEDQPDSFRGKVTSKGPDRSNSRMRVGRFASKSARTATGNVEKPQRMKLKIRSAREAGIKKLPRENCDNSLHQNSNAPAQNQHVTMSLSNRFTGRKINREGLATASDRDAHTQNSLRYKPSGRKHDRVDESHTEAGGTTDQELEGSTESVDRMGQLQPPDEVELSETQRYVKMIQQLTAYLPEHLLATAEDQIRKMSNTDQIMKFKKKMIQKNHAAMEKDTKADPRWRRLEGTLIRSGSNAKWHKQHSAWQLKET